MSQQSSQEIIDKLEFCVIDLETTGGNHYKDKIIEIGMIKVKNRKVVGEKSLLINPQMQIPDFIQKLTNIKQNDVKDAPIIEDVIEEILDFIGEDIIVAHNTSFDVPFLNSVLDRLDKEPLINKVICTNVMTKHLIPEILNSNLNYMSRLFNIDHSKAHRAYDDALATAKLLIIYLDIFIEKGIRKVNQLYYPRNKFELDRIHLDESSSLDDLKELLCAEDRSYQITVKGERGLILAVVPLESSQKEFEFCLEILKEIDWKIITIQLMRPMLEGIFLFNNHYLKYPEEVRTKIKDYLYSKYPTTDENKVNINSIDFLITHHLISDQVIAYSFLHLNTNNRPIFKVPAQKKKLYQYLNGQVSRFETNQKGNRKHLIHTDLIELVQNVLHHYRSSNRYLYLDRKLIKNDKETSIKYIEDFVSDSKVDSKFPLNHL